MHRSQSAPHALEDSTSKPQWHLVWWTEGETDDKECLVNRLCVFGEKNQFISLGFLIISNIGEWAG